MIADLESFEIVSKAGAMALRVEAERTRVASGDQSSGGCLKAIENFTRALSALQNSEEEIRNRCTKLLESLP